MSAYSYQNMDWVLWASCFRDWRLFSSETRCLDTPTGFGMGARFWLIQEIATQSVLWLDTDCTGICYVGVNARPSPAHPPNRSVNGINPATLALRPQARCYLQHRTPLNMPSMSGSTLRAAHSSTRVPSTPTAFILHCGLWGWAFAAAKPQSSSEREALVICL